MNAINDINNNIDNNINRNRNKKTKFLLIHGFGGGVYEVKPLADLLITIGFEAVCPLLKGHSATRKEMQAATCEGWIESAEKELLALKKTSDDAIILIGFSMGSLIAFNLACMHEVKAIVIINAPIYYWNISQMFLNIVEDLRNKRSDYLKRYFVETGNFPLNSLIQFLKLLYKTKPLLQKILCPVLMIQAEDDDTVKTKSVDYIYRHLSSEKKVIKLFSKGGHGILQSSAAEQVISCIEAYINEIAPL